MVSRALGGGRIPRCGGLRGKGGAVVEQAASPGKSSARFMRRVAWIALGVAALALGLALVVVGAGMYTGAHEVRPIAIDGYVADYREILVDGTYARNELVLAHDPHTYVLDNRQFQPALPERFYQDARTTIWVDQGTTNVVAITLYDLMGLNPITYTTRAYDNPAAAVATDEIGGGALAFLGILVAIAVPASAAVARRRGVSVPALAAQSARMLRPAGRPQQPSIADAPTAHLPAPARQTRAEPPSISAARVSLEPTPDQLPTRPAPAIQPPSAAPLPAQPPSAAQYRPAPEWASMPPSPAPVAPARPAMPVGALPLSDTFDELPTQKTPAVTPFTPTAPAEPITPAPPFAPIAPAAPIVPAEPIVPVAPVMPIEIPPDAAPLLPRFGPEILAPREDDEYNWGAAWAARPHSSDRRSPHTPASPRLVPANQPPTDPAPDADRPAPVPSDVSDLPTGKAPVPGSAEDYSNRGEPFRAGDATYDHHEP